MAWFCRVLISPDALISPEIKFNFSRKALIGPSDDEDLARHCRDEGFFYGCCSFCSPLWSFNFFNVFSARARQLLHRARYSADTRAGAPSLVQFKALLTTTPRGSRLGAEQDVWRCLRRQTSKGTHCCCKHDFKQILFFLFGMWGLFKNEGSPACWPHRAQQWASRLLALAGGVTRDF